jgi:hypothetical protein
MFVTQAKFQENTTSLSVVPSSNHAENTQKVSEIFNKRLLIGEGVDLMVIWRTDSSMCNSMYFSNFLYHLLNNHSIVQWLEIYFTNPEKQAWSSINTFCRKNRLRDYQSDPITHAMPHFIGNYHCWQMTSSGRCTTTGGSQTLLEKVRDFKEMTPNSAVTPLHSIERTKKTHLCSYQSTSSNLPVPTYAYKWCRKWEKLMLNNNNSNKCIASVYCLGPMCFPGCIYVFILL